jgi:hypothetical protein
MKRFTEITKWRDPWFRKLSPAGKLLWMWLTDNCDAAGVIDLDLEHASFEIGMPVVEQTVVDLGRRVERLPSGKWRIVKFLEFQYGQLSDTCPAHKPVFRALKAHGLDQAGNRLCDRVSSRVSDTLQEEDIYKDKDKKGNEGAGERGPGIPNSEAQVRSMAEQAGVDPEYAVTIWNEHEGSEWVDSSNRPIKNFAHYLKARWNHRQDKHARDEKRAALRTSGPGPPRDETVHALQIRIDKARDRIAKLQGGSYRDEEAAAEARAEIEQLQQNVKLWHQKIMGLQ